MSNVEFGQERIDEPTPHGGDYSLVFFFDKNGNRTSPDDAKEYVIQEFDKAGNLIFETVTEAQPR